MKSNMMPSLVVAVVVVVSLKFLLDGITVTLFGHTANLGHMDPMAYVSILGPVLGAHGYIEVRKPRPKKMKVDNPDDN